MLALIMFVLYLVVAIATVAAAIVSAHDNGFTIRSILATVFVILIALAFVSAASGITLAEYVDLQDLIVLCGFSFVLLSGCWLDLKRLERYGFAHVCLVSGIAMILLAVGFGVALLVV